MQISDYTGNPLGNIQKGIDFSQGIQNDYAQKQAGNILAQTANPAAAPLFQTGQLDAGSKVQAYQQDQQKQALAQHLDFLGKAADALSQIPDTDGRQTARRQALYEHIAPGLAQMGYKPEEIAQLQNADLSDQALSVFRGQVKLQLEKIGNDVVGFTPSGQSRVLYQGEDAAPKHDWKERINADGSSTWIDLNAPPGAPATAPTSVTTNTPASGASGSAISTGLDRLGKLGVTMTSAYRSPEHNADVGGVANSQHLTGQAVDLVPPKGMSMAQLAAAAQQSMPGAKVINENDHVHVQWGSSAPPATPAAAGGIPGSAPGTKGRNAQWQILNDQKNGNQPYRYNAATGQATTLDGKPYTPIGAAKISGGGTPRSATALAVQRYIEATPNATADDISAFNAKMKMQGNAATAFGTGKQGQTINSINVAVDHLGTMRQAADALRNGNIQLFNKLGNDFAAATGNDAPTNFDAVKQIVADEVVKSIVGSGAAAGDREKAQAILSRANSPDQLSGAISEIQKLMAGQLRGLRLQYKNSTGQDDFETHLLPETRQQLEKLEPSGGSSGASAAGAKRPPLSAIFGR
jgi:hypothetical protein